MTEYMVFGRDFTVEQCKFKRGFNIRNCKGRNGRGRPKGSRNK